MRTGHPLLPEVPTLPARPYLTAMDPDPSHLCCSSAKISSHYHKVYFHPPILPSRKFHPKEPRKGSFTCERERIKLPSIYEKEGKEESKQATLVPRKVPTYPWKEELSLSTFSLHRAEFGINVIERKVIFTPPFSSSFCMRRMRRSENRESRIENRLRARDHSLTQYMDTIAAVLPSASASVQEEGGEREKRIAAAAAATAATKVSPLPPKRKLPY